MARVLMILLGLLLSGVFGTSVGVSQTGVDPARLQFTISTEKETFLVGEPVRLLFRLKNLTDKDMTSDFWLSFDFDRLRVWISGDGGRSFEPYVSMAMKIASEKKRGRALVTIKAGESIEAFEYISFNTETNGFAFPHQGRYLIKVTLFYNFFGQRLDSNTVDILVVKPTGVDESALSFITNNGLEYFLTPEARLFPYDDNTVRRLKEFVGLFPESTYRPFAELALQAMCKGRFDLPSCTEP